MALCFLVHGAAGIAGVDFGEVHWDEPMVLGNARYALNTGTPLPRHYMHPTASVLLLAAAIPDLAWDRLPPGRETAAMRRPALMRARTVFSIVASTTIIAAALAAFARRRSHVEAVLAAAIVAGSFELSSHGRFLVPDGVLTASTAWALCAAVWSLRRPNLLWVAAACAGVAAGAKYSGALVIVPALVAAACSAQRRIPRLAGVVVVSCIAFVLTTPGIVVEPRFVIGAFQYQQRVYAGGFFGYSIFGWVDHGIAIVQLLATALPSNVAAIALTWAALALTSLILEVRRFRFVRSVEPSMLILLTFAALWTVVFWRHPAHIARNFLPLLPVLAILAARAGTEIVVAIPVRAARGVQLVFFILATVSIADVVAASASINSQAQPVVDLLDFIDLHEDEKFMTSPAVLKSLAEVDPQQRPNLISGPAGATRLIAFPDELLPMSQWGGGDTFLADEVFGPREINWNLYPTWGGPRRAVVMKIAKVRALGASMEFNAQVDVPVPPPFPDELIKIELPRLRGEK